MKKLIMIIVLLASVISVNAQFEVSMNYGSKQVLRFDCNYAGKNNMVYGVSFGGKFPSGSKGEYYSNIGWNEFNEDVTKVGKYNIVMNGFVGYKVKNIIFGGILGFSEDVLYKNCYDGYEILGNNGKYYLTRADKIDPNIGLSLKYIKDNVIINTYYTNMEGLGFGIGLLF